MMNDCEWYGGNVAGHLHIQVHLGDRKRLQELQAGLQSLGGETSWDSEGSSFHIVVDYSEEKNIFLKELESVIDRFNATCAGTGKADIVETRLVPMTRGKSAHHIKSRFTISPYNESEKHSDVIFLEAERSFGSGMHPSTRLVLQFLENTIEGPFPARILDVGCGSGILSLVCAKLGAQRVVGIDVCGHAVAVAQQNIRKNELEETVTISDTPLSEIQGTFDLILANLTPSVFWTLQEGIRSCSTTDTRLIVSGLQGRQADEVALSLSHQGWSEVKKLSSGTWQAMLFIYS